MKNKLIIAAAGSGKTTFLVEEALKVKDKKVLITTFTEANEKEINKKLIEINGFVPSNIKVQTWFSFLIQHGVKPYQSLIYEGKINGLFLVNRKSGIKYCSHGRPVYYPEDEVQKYYFNEKKQIYSDKLSKFVCRANEKGNGLVIHRLSRIYPYIFIDEVQDLAGFDLEIIKLLLLSSVNLMMVGDPRQVTYHTHDEAKYKKYKDGKIEEFIREQCKKIDIDIDKETLCVSHRNKKDICLFANQLFPEFTPCGYVEQTYSEHDGIYFVKPNDVDEYLDKFSPIQLREKVNVRVNENYKVMNFGDSKGLTFDRVLIYPTKPMLDWIVDHSKELKPKSKSKLYVALTRARHSVGIVYDNKNHIKIKGIQDYCSENKEKK